MARWKNLGKAKYVTTPHAQDVFELCNTDVIHNPREQIMQKALLFM
jgi:hypothetical protein